MMTSDDQKVFSDEHCLGCKFCKYNTKDNEHFWTECYDCCGEHDKWEPSIDFMQHMLKHSRKNAAVIIMCFPGVGRKYFIEKFKESNITIVNTDDINVIKASLEDNNIILCSADKNMQDTIYSDITIMSSSAVYICYPDINIKDKWVKNKYCTKSDFNKQILDIKLENRFFPLVLRSDDDYLSNHINETIIKL